MSFYVCWLSVVSSCRLLHAGLSIYWNRNDEYYTSAPWRGTWDKDGGMLMNQATHGIDLVQWLLGGNPRRVHGRLARFLRPIETEDFASAKVEFDGGAIATLQATVDAYPKNLGSRLVVIGETGTVELSGAGLDTIETWRFPQDPAWLEVDRAATADPGTAAATPDADATRAAANPATARRQSGHAAVYGELAESVAQDREPFTGFADARVSAEIVLAILQSHRLGQAVDFPVEFSTAEMAGTPL